MKPTEVFFAYAALALVALALAAPGAGAEAHWPAWRGPDNNGAAPQGNPPTTWSETENIKWKVALPGSGQSTPVVWGDKMFILAAAPADGSAVVRGGEDEGGGRGRRMSTGSPRVDWIFEIVCLDRNSGEILWRQTAARERPQEGHHPTGSFAPYSAVTDGKHVWASFGSRGLYCYDLEGKLQWSQPLAKMETRMGFGEGSSPALTDDAVIVLQDHEGQSRIGAYAKADGKLLWEKNRDEITSWSTPHVVTEGGVTQVITNATDRIRSYNAATGDVIWECGGMTVNVVPTPLTGFGKAYCASGFRGAALTAVDLSSTGDVTGKPAWHIGEHTPYVPTPLLYGERLYYLEGLNARISCANAKTGEVIFARKSIESLGLVYASPVGAGGHVYVADRGGMVAVLADSDSFEVVATNKLDDGFDASPVVAGDTLYLKGNTYLYCIAAS